MTNEEKLEQLEALSGQEKLGQEDLPLLRQLAKDRDPFIRGEVPYLLMAVPGDEALTLLLALASDQDPLVRCEAYDSLSAFSHPLALECLARALTREGDDLARSYAILSWAELSLLLDLAQAGRERAQRQEASQESKRCRLSWLYAQYLFGDTAKLREILSYLEDPDYLLRSTALALLSQIALLSQMALGQNEAITSSLRALLTREDVPALRERAQGLLRELLAEAGGEFG